MPWYDELRIVAAGPAATLALALVSLGGCLLLHLLFGENLTATVLLWAGVINAALFGYNMLPMGTLDGGRIARVLLEHRLERMKRYLTILTTGAALGFALCPVAVLAGWYSTATLLALAGLLSTTLLYLRYAGRPAMER